jgi:hypothetical protein
LFDPCARCEPARLTGGDARVDFSRRFQWRTPGLTSLASWPSDREPADGALPRGRPAKRWREDGSADIARHRTLNQRVLPLGFGHRIWA